MTRQFTINDYDREADSLRRVMPIAGPEVDAINELVDDMITDDSDMGRVANVGRELLEITMEQIQEAYYK